MAHRQRTTGLPTSAALLVVGLVPLLGIIGVAGRSVADAYETRGRAREAAVAAQEAVELSRLDAALFDEMVWTAINQVTVDLDIPTGMIADLTGSDPVAELADRQEHVDDAAITLSDAWLTTRIAELRTKELSVNELLDEYGTVSMDLNDRVDNVLIRLTSASKGSGYSADVVRSIEVLRLAVATRRSGSEMFYGYFATLFELRDPPREELVNLIGLRRDFEDGIDTLRALGDDAITVEVALIDDDQSVTDLLAVVDRHVDALLTDGVPDQAQELTLDSMMSRIDDATAVYTAAGSSTLTTAALIDAAARGVDDAIQEVSNASTADMRRANLLAALLALSTGLAVFLGSRFIVRPLSSLQDAADTLRAGTIRLPGTKGPREVRAAAAALGEAAAHVDLATRQAQALALGELDADVLDESLVGGLGAALHDAVGTLRTALEQQDEFRTRLAHEASHDGLTSLPNRNASMAQLNQSLARTRRSDSTLAVLFVDLDHFKEINDVHGHQAGDVVLTTVARRLASSVREGDHVGRLGGDEFVVIAEPIADIEESVTLARRIVDAIEQPIDIGPVRVTVGASIGVAVTEDSTLTADELLRDADLAVYRVKETGRGGVEICNEDLRSEMAEAADLSVALRRAIDEDELLMHYQPIVDPHTGQLQAVESLVRWHRPGTPGLTPPDAFIGFAERSNLIIDLDRWVLDAVARQIASWRDAGAWAGWPVAVNISGRHLGHEHFVEHVLEPLERHRVDPSAIIVEITESAILDDLNAAAHSLEALRERGVRVSIDDFGTGYASLAHLRSLPVDILKLDRSFTVNAMSGTHEESIVKLVIDTGHLLGATVTAEGVETEAEADKLTALGSDTLQGFYFARPRAPEDLFDGRTAGSASTV